MRRAFSYVTAGLVLAALWWVLTGADAASWLIGLPTILAALAAFHCLAGHARPHYSVRVLGVLRFLPFFLVRCFTAGLDVALRALRRSMPLDPALVHYRTCLPAGPPRVALVNVISLLPGTLSADLEQDLLTVHLLDQNQDYRADLARVERAIGDVFGIERGRPPGAGA